MKALSSYWIWRLGMHGGIRLDRQADCAALTLALLWSAAVFGGAIILFTLLGV